MNTLKTILSGAVLCWFISISVSLIVGILFLTDFARGDNPLVLDSLWFITLFALPSYVVCSFYPRRVIGLYGASAILIVLSYTISAFSFPKPDSIAFIGPVMEADIDDGMDDGLDLDDSHEDNQVSTLELPDEL